MLQQRRAHRRAQQCSAARRTCRPAISCWYCFCDWRKEDRTTSSSAAASKGSIFTTLGGSGTRSATSHTPPRSGRVCQPLPCAGVAGCAAYCLSCSVWHSAREPAGACEQGGVQRRATLSSPLRTGVGMIVMERRRTSRTSRLAPERPSCATSDIIGPHCPCAAMPVSMLCATHRDESAQLGASPEPRCCTLRSVPAVHQYNDLLGMPAVLHDCRRMPTTQHRQLSRASAPAAFDH